MKKGTKTSNFGISKRENHDSSRFYSGRLYGRKIEGTDENLYVENKINKKCLNRIFVKSSEKMEELPECSVHLMVTSSPYNVGKE